MNRFKKIIVIALLLPLGMHGQSTIDPELQQFHSAANQALAQRDYNKAISIYIQAINARPNDIILRRDLAYAYYLSGNPKEGLVAIEQVIKTGAADEETYQIAAALEKANGSDRKSLRTIEDGLRKYPNSGLLHYAKGMNRAKDGKLTKQSLDAFRQGIEVAPHFPNNYMGASKYLMENNEAVWSVIYAEIAVNLDPNSSKAFEAKKHLYEAYKQLFTTKENLQLPDFKNPNRKHSFAQDVQYTMANHSIVMVDGISVENLIMLRTRFILDWRHKLEKEDHSLFQYFEQLLQLGHFDAYNQFMFGAITDSRAFSNWVQQHNNRYVNYGKWAEDNPYRPLTTDPKY